MKKFLHICGVVAMVVLPLSAQAQTQYKDSTLNRTVVVEQEYNPYIMDASKVNVMPKLTPPSTTPKSVEYDESLSPAQEIPSTTMQAYTATEDKEEIRNGYVRLGYGNYGNLDVKANYLFAPTSIDQLNISVAMNGMNGKLELPNDNNKWDARYYRTLMGLDYLHSFRKADFKVAAHFGVSNFNFLPQSTDGRQKFTSGGLHFGVKSSSDDLPIQYHAETNLLLYQRRLDVIASNSRETLIRTKAGAQGNISDEQRVGVDLVMNNAFYSSDAFSNYTSVELNPYYLYHNDDWNIRLGANVDLATGFGKKLRVSPDVTADYNFSDSYILYARATGGRQENDFRKLESASPFGVLYKQIDATYEQWNAALGLKASPASGLWFNLYGGHQNLKGALAPMQVVHIGVSGNVYSPLTVMQADMSNVYAAVHASYNYRQTVGFSAKGIYRNWSMSGNNIQLLAFMPQFEADIKAEVQPTSTSLITLGYHHISRTKVNGLQIDAVGNLYLSAHYQLFDGISIYLRANNLLNKEYQYYHGYPVEGLNFLGGVSFNF